MDRLRGPQSLVGVVGRHAHVDDGHVGQVRAHRPLERGGVGHRGHDVVAAAGQGLGQPVPHDRGVLGDHDAQPPRGHQACPGSSIVMTVGPPGGLSHAEAPVDGLHPFEQPREAPAGGQAGSAGPVVGHGHQQPPVLVADADRGAAGPAVLGRVGQQLAAQK